MDDDMNELLRQIRKEMLRIVNWRIGMPNDPVVILTWALGALQKIPTPISDSEHPQ